MHNNSKFISKLIIILLTNLLFFNGILNVSAQEYQNEKPGYDIVFALDISASMNTTDKNRNSIEIIKMMIDMCTANNTRIGFVAYNDTINTHFSLADVSNRALRKDLKEAIDDCRFFGYSDMGLGLDYALKLITESNDIGNKPIVILLSDGETDLSGSKTGRTEEDSNTDLENSLTTSIKYSIPIYTVGLTGDFNGNLDYLKDIALKTGGLSYTATSPYELVDIFNGILSENTSSVLTPGETIQSTGKTQYLDVNVSDDSLSELNIMLLSDKSLSITDVLTSSQNVDITSSSSYKLIKIKNPVRETVRLKAKADKGSDIRLSTLGTYSFSDIISVPDSIEKNKSTTFSFQFMDLIDHNLVSDEALYQGISLSFFIKDLATNEETKLTASADENGFRAKTAFSKPGRYEIRAQYDGTSIFGKTPYYTFEVINLPPEKKQELEVTIPKEKGTKTYDLSTLFSNNDGDILDYSIISQKGADATIKLQGESLFITPNKYGDIILKVQAQDKDGGKAESNIVLHSIPIWKFYHTTTLIVIIIAVTILTLLLSFFIIRFFKKRISMPKPVFTGSLVGYFLTLKDGGEIPPLKWQLHDYPNKGLSLSKLMKARSVELSLPGAEKIWFSPKVGNSIELIHNSKCTILVGSATIARNNPATVHLGDKIYIAFEDMSSEIEIRYKNA